MSDIPVPPRRSGAPFEDALAALRAELWDASPQDLGHSLLGVARQARRELRGQLRGLPDLSRPGALDPESILIWEILPEVCRRLIERSGVDLLMSPQERRTVPCDHLTDIELRGWVAECLRPSRFAGAGEVLRANPDRFPVQPGGLFMADILGVRVERGHIAEIATARLIETGPYAGKPLEDRMSLRIQSFAKMGGRLFDERTWSPELQIEISDWLDEPSPPPANSPLAIRVEGPAPQPS